MAMAGDLAENIVLGSLQIGVVEQVGGEVLQSVYTALYKLVEEVLAKKDKFVFRPLLEDLKSKLDSLQLLFEKMAQHNNVVHQGRTKKLRLEMEQGVELLEKYSKTKITSWNTYRKFKYSHKFRNLNESLERLLTSLNIQVAKAVQKSINSLTETGIFKTKGVTELPKPPSFIVGMDEPLTQVKMKLLKDEIPTILVVTGPAGCGKTTLATRFCDDKQVREIFQENIFFVTMSKKPNYEIIVEQLHQRKGSQVPAMLNNEIAETLLQQFLKDEGKNPLLLVLDDVWAGAESHIQKCYDIDAKMQNYKILVTSRYEFPGFGSPYCLESLNEVTAMTLFRHSASLDDKSSYISENLSKKLHVVEHCKGIPLAITVVGRSLCGQPVEVWEKRVIEWSKASIFDSETELLLRFKSSWDILETGLKKCFMDLGSFPKHCKISVAALVDMWIELYDLDDEIVCIANIYELAARNLAYRISSRKVEMDGDRYNGDQFVTQHDLLRELAIHQTKQENLGQRKRLIIDISGDNTPKWWRNQKYPTVKARVVSISTDSMFSMEWQNMELPEAEVLVLNFEANYALPKFVETMGRLKVMIVTNHGPLPVDLSNFQLLGSLPHFRILRLERISIASITTHYICFTSLKKISFFMCDIGQASINIKISDGFPNLEEMIIDHCNDLVELPDEVCDLGFLKRLCITNCPKLSALPEEIGKLVRLEVLRLRSCTDLKNLPNSIKNLKKLRLLDISGCLSIEELQDNFAEMSSLKTINMRRCSSLKKLPPSLYLQQLEQVLCDEATEALCKQFLPNTIVRVLKKEVSSEI